MNEVENHILVVRTSAVPGRESEFEEWYRRHVDEVLQLPGFTAGSRFRANIPVPPAGPAEFDYLAIYEISGPIAERLQDLTEVVDRLTPTDAKDARVEVTSFRRLGRAAQREVDSE